MISLEEVRHHIFTPIGSTDLLDDDGSIIQPDSWRHEEDTCAIMPLQNVLHRPKLHSSEVREKFT